jgi:hypothetical protein
MRRAVNVVIVENVVHAEGVLAGQDGGLLLLRVAGPGTAHLGPRPSEPIFPFTFFLVLYLKPRLFIHFLHVLLAYFLLLIIKIHILLYLP